VEELRKEAKSAALDQPSGYNNMLMGINEFFEGPRNTPEVSRVLTVGVAADGNYQFSRQGLEI
jgi:hypothetical protein